MHPILFVWRGIVIRSFHVMVYAALLLTVFLAVAFAQRDGLDPDRTALAIVLLFIPGFIGARLLYAARHWDHFRSDPRRIVRRSEGGLSLYGGLFGMMAGSLPLLWALALPFGCFWDALALGTLAGIAVAKVGCLFNGCCHGRPTDHWSGAVLPDEKGVWRRRFPSPLMEIAWAVGILLVLLALRAYSPPSGSLVCATLALLPAGRLFLQGLRDEGRVEDVAVRKTCFFLIAAALIAGCIVWLL